MHSKMERIAKEAQFRVPMSQGATSGFVLGPTRVSREASARLWGDDAAVGFGPD